MKSRILAATAGLAVAGSLWFGFGTAFGNSEALRAAAVLPVAAVAIEAEAAQPIPALNPARACIETFSKDVCQGSGIGNGVLMSGGCPGTNCRTIHTHSVPLFFELQTNQQPCASGQIIGRCDELPQKDGRLRMEATYMLRLHDPCNLRGYLSARGEYHANDGSIYRGSLQSTLGVGTHRASACLSNPNRTCERCRDVEFDAANGYWRVGFEGIFTGTCINSTNTTPEELRFSISGDFLIPGDANGPFDYSGGWRFLGTIDGAHTVYCN